MTWRESQDGIPIPPGERITAGDFGMQDKEAQIRVVLMNHLTPFVPPDSISNALSVFGMEPHRLQEE